MESLAETESEKETTDGKRVDDADEAPGEANLDNSLTSTSKTQSCTAVDKQVAEFQQSKETSEGVDGESVGCVPFFGVKHYLHNFYGLPDDESGAKVWRQIETGNEDDYFAILTAGQSKSEIECWHVHRRCFAWSVSIGSIIVLLGMTGLLLGFLLPRHPVLVGQMEENDLKMWIAAHSGNSDSSVTSLNILDRKAVEHNNLLDILKVGGMMATCIGVLMLVIALIFPPGRHPSTWAEEDNTPHISQINQALKNCLRSADKNQPTFFYSGLVASTTDEKIPVFQHLQSVQPRD